MRFLPAARPSTWIVLGIAAIGLALLPTVRTTLLVLNGSDAPGVVTSISQRGDSSEWDLEFAFTDQAGTTHAVQTTFMSSNTCPSLKAGDSMPVVYDRASPSRAAVRSFETLWLRQLFYLTFGGIFVGVPLGIAWLYGFMGGRRM